MKSVNRNWRRIGVGAIVLVLGLAACGEADLDEADEAAGDEGAEPDEAAEATEASEAELSVTTLHPDGYWQVTPIVSWLDAVEDATDGRVTAEYHFAGALVDDAETSSALADGIVDVGYAIPAYTPANFPIETWKSEWAFLHDSRPVVGMLQAFAASVDWGFSTPEAMEELEANGLVPLLPGVHNIPDYHLMCDEPVTSLENAEGKRARTGGPAWEDIAESIGMTPTALSPAEIFEAFDRGVVDCFLGGYPDAAGLGVWDVATHTTEVGFTGWSSYHVALGQPMWDQLNTAARQAIWDNIDSYLEEFLLNSLDEHRNYVIEGEERGIEFHTMEEDLAQAVEDHQNQVVETTVERAPDGVDEPERMFADYQETYDRWLDIVLELGYEQDAETWAEWAQQEGDELDIDLGPIVDRIVEEIYEPNRPR